MLEKPKDLAALLTNLERNDVLFIDEIHRLSPVVEEILYPALEDYQIDIMIGEGPAARSIKLDLQPFTLVGATTRAGMLTNPLRDRFGIVARLEFYTAEELARIVRRSAGLLNVPMDEAGGLEIARRSRGTPRIANRLLRRVRDYAEVKGDGRITEDIAHKALAMLDVDPQGFDLMDRKLLEAVIHRFDGGPVGLDNIAASIGEESRHHRGRDRALPDPAGLPAAHAARAHRHAGGLPAPGRRAAAARRRHVRQLRSLFMHTHDLSGWQHEHRFQGDNHAAERSTRLVMWITAAAMLLEIGAGWWFNSMALLADGWHMSSHAVAIGLSAFAYAAARRYAGDRRFAFGTWKIEVLGGFASALFLLGVAVLMVVGSLERLWSPAADPLQGGDRRGRARPAGQPGVRAAARRRAPRSSRSRPCHAPRRMTTAMT